MSSPLDSLKYNADGLIPAVVQDHANGQVLMLAWMNRESIAQTLATGLVTDHPKGRLQELVKPIHGNTALRYETVQSGGVDHAKEYVSTLYLAERPLGTGRGLSKKTAEEAAAREALHAHALGGVI
jgi:ribonuclease-3